eukprot:scaffold32257_cov56-Phaeocystis_antarctica.AAC.3
MSSPVRRAARAQRGSEGRPSLEKAGRTWLGLGLGLGSGLGFYRVRVRAGVGVRGRVRLRLVAPRSRRV